ncbi:unnamed protein product, partial [Coregonus sp. 'balchen']
VAIKLYHLGCLLTYQVMDRQVWERPWTLEEMRQTSANWSLAADSGLFLFLQDFSQRMLSKTHEIEKQLDGLIRDSKATDCCLHTRVYDEEVEEPGPKPEALERPPEQLNSISPREKTREQKEAELIPKVQEAVNYGLRVLDSAFEQLDIKAGNSDSEDEEATDRVEPILEPKDLYVDRPLPYLIGSQLFMAQDDIGLGDLSSEEMSIDSDRESVIESGDGKDVGQSDDDFDQEVEGPGSIKKKSSMLSVEEDKEGDSDIFGESDSDEDDRKSLCHIQNTGPSSFADELAARIKGEPISKPEGDRTSLSSASKKNSKAKKEPKPEWPPAVEDDSEELFGLPKMEDENFSPFGGKGSLFSGGRGLFDDEENLYVSVVFLPEPVKPATKIPSGAVSIFPENSLFGTPNDSDSVEGRERGIPDKPNKTQTSAPRKTAGGGGGRGGGGRGGGGGGLFDEEDVFFTGKSLKKSSSAGQEKLKQKKTGDLFGGGDEDEDGDIFSESYGAQSRREVVEEVKKICPTIPKSQSKPEPTPQSKASKAPLSIFDDEEEEDLFASAKKSKPSQAEAVTPHVKKHLSIALFSDDKDQWMNSKPSAGKTEGKTGGMKSSDSAPSSLPSVIAAPKDSLFDEDDDDLFATTKESSQKKPQRVSLLFEDETEDDEDTRCLFGFKPATPAVASPAPSLFHTDKPEEVTAPPSPQRAEKERVAKEGPEVQHLSSPLEGSESKKKPLGAVSLFGGINVLGAAKTKSPLDETDGDDFMSKEGSPPMEKEAKTKNTVSLFDDEEGADWTAPQRDNDPDVDIFATPDKSVSGPSSMRSAAPTLFSDEDGDSLFSSVKPKALRPTNLVINPAANLPGAVLPGMSPSPSPSLTSSGLSPNLTPSLPGTQSPSDGGVSFDHPVQVSVLQSANKGRAKGSSHRRPQTRAARQTAAQSSVDQRDQNQGEDRAGPSPTLPNPTQPSLALSNLTLPRPSLPNQAPTTALPSSLPASQPTLTDVSVRPSVLTLAVSNTPLKRETSKGSKVKVLPSPDEADLFGSDSLFGSVPALAPAPNNTTHSPKLTTKTTEGELTPKKEKEATPPSLFDDPMGDLFQKVKTRSAKKAKASSFLEDEEDIFVLGKSCTPTTNITAGGKVTKAGGNSTPKQDLFQDEAETPPKAYKEKSLDASLFDDNVDIFADLTATSKLKEKKSKKAETKSIFHDDMDDVFSPSTVKPMAKQPPSKSKKSPPSQDTSAADDSGNIFDDPLNALGGN